MTSDERPPFRLADEVDDYLDRPEAEDLFGEVAAEPVRIEEAS